MTHTLDDPELTEQARRATLASYAATILGANDLATKATTLGEKMFWRMLRDEVRKQYEVAGGVIGDVPVEGAAVVLTLPSPPHIVFQERDIELMRAAVAAHDAAAAPSTRARADTAPNGPATASHMLATLADGCCCDTPDERDHVANVVVQACIDAVARSFRASPMVTVEEVVQTLRTLKMDVDDCTFCHENWVQSCGE